MPTTAKAKPIGPKEARASPLTARKTISVEAASEAAPKPISKPLMISSASHGFVSRYSCFLQLRRSCASVRAAKWIAKMSKAKPTEAPKMAPILTPLYVAPVSLANRLWASPSSTLSPHALVSLSLMPFSNDLHRRDSLESADSVPLCPSVSRSASDAVTAEARSAEPLSIARYSWSAKASLNESNSASESLRTFTMLMSLRRSEEPPRWLSSSAMPYIWLFVLARSTPFAGSPVTPRTSGEFPGPSMTSGGLKNSRKRAAVRRGPPVEK
mmetsp:Transcript_36401/g.85023  ORF Transcript_36401/g.85023 Transcript_36401/m.85023 type:complete len:270 (-) Transcript_36401:2483-3292(-)